MKSSVAAFDENFGTIVKNKKTSDQKASANTLRICRVQIRCVYAAYTQRICTFFCVDSHLNGACTLANLLKICCKFAFEFAPGVLYTSCKYAGENSNEPS